MRKNTLAFWLAMGVIIACFIYTQVQAGSPADIEIDNSQGERPHDWMNRVYEEGQYARIVRSEKRCFHTLSVDRYIADEGYFLAVKQGAWTEVYTHSDGRHFIIYRNLQPGITCLIDWGY